MLRQINLIKRENIMTEGSKTEDKVIGIYDAALTYISDHKISIAFTAATVFSIGNYYLYHKSIFDLYQTRASSLFDVIENYDEVVEGIKYDLLHNKDLQETGMITSFLSKDIHVDKLIEYYHSMREHSLSPYLPIYGFMATISTLKTDAEWMQDLQGGYDVILDFMGLNTEVTE
jgi:hypothetical protein